MGGVGRKGAVNWLYETVISLILLGLFAVVVYLYISANATGEIFYSKFYAADLATTAELAAAPSGDVLLRYDNLKPNLELGFWLENGRIAVAPYTTEQEPPIAAVHKYGIVKSYPLPLNFKNPTYLALRKVGESFSITDADIELDTCPAREPTLKLSDAVVSFTGKGITDDSSRRMETSFSSIIDTSKILTGTPDQATLKLTVEHVQGQKNSLSFSQVTEDGQQLACLFWRQLQLVSLTEFPKQDAPLGGTFDLVITITTTPDSRVTPEQMGSAAAFALTRLYG